MMKNIDDMLQPVIEEKTGIYFTYQLSKNINSTITSPEIQGNASSLPTKMLKKSCLKTMLM